MNHTTLQMFKIVAEEQSVTKAAQRLGRVQSNITTRIQQLEEDLGVALFVRDSKKMILSPEGESFLSYTKKILSLAEEARQALHPGKPAGALNMGSMEATAVSRLMPVFQQFHRRYPDVELALTTQPTQQLLEQVRHASLDCALVSLLPDAGGHIQCPEDLEYLDVFTERLVLLVPETASSTKPLLAAFPRGCSYRARAEALLNAQTLVEVQDVSSYHSMIASVAAGRCSGVLPEGVAATLILPEGTQQQFVANALTQLVWRKGYRSTALEAMKQILASASNL